MSLRKLTNQLVDFGSRGVLGLRKLTNQLVDFGVVAVLGVALLSCQSPGNLLQAFRVTDREQLFGGGPRALGDVGDYMLMNDQIRVVIQDAGFSRSEERRV